MGGVQRGGISAGIGRADPRATDFPARILLREHERIRQPISTLDDARKDGEICE